MDINVNVSFSAITLTVEQQAGHICYGRPMGTRAGLSNGANAALIHNGCSVLDLHQRGVTKSVCEHVKDLEIQVWQSRD